MNNNNQDNVFIKALSSKDPAKFMNNLSQHNSAAVNFMQLAGGLLNMDLTQGEQVARDFCRQNNINFDVAFAEFKKFLQQKKE